MKISKQQTVAAFTVGQYGPNSAIITEENAAHDGLMGFLSRHPNALRFTSKEGAERAYYEIKDKLEPGNI